MLAVQRYLHQHGLSRLREEFAIEIVEHPHLPLVILNYDQINSPRSETLCRQCRGLTLEKESWRVVAKAFDRFFNWGEMAHEMGEFDWSDCHCQAKEDGSLILIYQHAGDWQINTRGSFGLDIPRGAPGNWRDLVRHCVGDLTRLQPGLVYVGELVTPWTTVVRRYPAPNFFLLTVFDLRGELPCELSVAEAQQIATALHWSRPAQYHFGSLEAVKEFLIAQESAVSV